MHYCDCKGTTKLQLLQRVFQRMLTHRCLLQFFGKYTKNIQNGCNITTFLTYLYDPRDAGESRPSSSSIRQDLRPCFSSITPPPTPKNRLGHYQKKGAPRPLYPRCFNNGKIIKVMLLAQPNRPAFNRPASSVVDNPQAGPFLRLASLI